MLEPLLVLVSVLGILAWARMQVMEADRARRDLANEYERVRQELNRVTNMRRVTEDLLLKNHGITMVFQPECYIPVVQKTTPH